MQSCITLRLEAAKRLLFRVRKQQVILQLFKPQKPHRQPDIACRNLSSWFSFDTIAFHAETRLATDMPRRFFLPGGMKPL